MNLGNGVDASFAQGDAADELAERAQAEGERVLAAAGLTVVSAEEDRERRGSILQRRPDLERRGGSTWQSLTRGTGDSEIDYLAGEVVLQGRLHGVPTPVNERRGRRHPPPRRHRRRCPQPRRRRGPRPPLSLERCVTPAVLSDISRRTWLGHRSPACRVRRAGGRCATHIADPGMWLGHRPPADARRPATPAG